MVDGIRSPAVAGQFYPGDPETLRRTVDGLLEGARPDPRAVRPKGLIVPHAGYQFSGPVAASAYSLLAAAEDVERVILLGPAHFHPLEGLALPVATAFETPLGLVEVDSTAYRAALSCPGVVADDAPHLEEHSLEVQIPFLQCTNPGATLLPIAVGPGDQGPIADLLDVLWEGAETVIVVSSDLSHYLGYAAARERDAATAAAIVSGRTGDLDPGDACGFFPLRGFLEAVRRHALVGRLLDLRNSGDTAGPRDNVVGYGAFAFAPAPA